MSRVVDLQSIMDVNDEDALVKMVNRARDNSVNDKKTVRNAKRFYVDIKELKKLMLVLVTSCALTVGAVGVVNAAQIVKDFDKPKLEDVSQEISSVIYGSSEESMHGVHYSSIANKNKVYNRSDDMNSFYYNHEGIAKDLLKLDGDTFDYAFCSVCVDMGKNINNLVGVGGRSNIDSVIFYLSLYSNMEGREINDYVKNAFNGIDNLNDYLVMNGYVDKNGEPSLDAFRKYCNEHASEVLVSIQDKSDSKGASIA